MDLLPAIGRVDDLCNIFTGIARAAARRGWPESATRAAGCLARELEKLAGELDGAAEGDGYQILATAAAARQSLPAAFNVFGQAFAETLLTSAGIRRPRREALDGG
jgi:hypothetical protein